MAAGGDGAMTASRREMPNGTCARASKIVARQERLIAERKARGQGTADQEALLSVAPVTSSRCFLMLLLRNVSAIDRNICTSDE